MSSKMAAAAASTLSRVGIPQLKVPPGLSDSFRVLTSKQHWIPRLGEGHQSRLELRIFNKRVAIDKAVRDSILGAAIGLGVAAVGIPLAVGAAGFTSAGIAAGSLGAKMMSVAAIANGGGVASGGVVATLQSIGAAGVPTAVTSVASATGAVLGTLKNLCV
ncbi:interferon alpha-inducible protein 27-like protein 2A [Erythrolamprus reginae]|uniref:interferon alpha-inducible protein 27-like protein 2A n=1 Tax=Erythrolamprus reginae TaxID=121349 RepID=UPI00396C3A78